MSFYFDNHIFQFIEVEVDWGSNVEEDGSTLHYPSLC